MRGSRERGRVAAVIALALLIYSPGDATQDRPPPPGEWERILTAAKKEGKVVVAIPPSAELRRQLETTLKQRFGLDTELVPAPGPANANRITSEYKAGVRYFDAFVFGSCTAVPLIHGGIFDSLAPQMILPEVGDPKNWWGGHIWMDNVNTKRYFYSFIAETSGGGLWYNTKLTKPEQIRSFDDLLNPKWKGKIGFSDPRVPGSGQFTWAFLWDIKGEDYLKELAQQELFLSRDLRQVGEALAKGKVALTIGVGYSQYEPFIKAGLPVKELPRPKEGLPSSNGFGTVGVLKDPPHPNAAKVFLNWLLSKDGQELYGRVMRHATRRLDVDTKPMVEVGVQAAKDFLTLDEYYRVRNHLEDKCVRIREPAAKFAEKILK